MANQMVSHHQPPRPPRQDPWALRAVPAENGAIDRIRVTNLGFARSLAQEPGVRFLMAFKDHHIKDMIIIDMIRYDRYDTSLTHCFLLGFLIYDTCKLINTLSRSMINGHVHHWHLIKQP